MYGRVPAHDWVPKSCSIPLPTNTRLAGCALHHMLSYSTVLHMLCISAMSVNVCHYASHCTRTARLLNCSQRHSALVKESQHNLCGPFDNHMVTAQRLKLVCCMIAFCNNCAGHNTRQPQAANNLNIINLLVDACQFPVNLSGSGCSRSSTQAY